MIAPKGQGQLIASDRMARSVLPLVVLPCPTAQHQVWCRITGAACYSLHILFSLFDDVEQNSKARKRMSSAKSTPAKMYVLKHAYISKDT